MSTTITVDDAVLEQVKNYNHYRAASRAAQNAESEAFRSGDDKAIRRTKREAKRAGEAFANASMALGWCMAEKLHAAGIEVDR